MPAVFCRLRQSYMGKIRSPEMGLRAVVYMVSTVAQDKSPRGVDYRGRRGRQRGRLLLTHSLVPPAGAAVNASGGHRAYLARGQRHRSMCGLVFMPASPWGGSQTASPMAAITIKCASVRDPAVALKTSFHLAGPESSSCFSVFVMTQHEGRGEMSFPWVIGGVPPLGPQTWACVRRRPQGHL